MGGRLRNKEIAERFGRNLRKARRRAGFSQEELGRLTSLHRTHIGYMEMGKRLPRADNLIKLASALAVTVDELLQRAVIAARGLPEPLTDLVVLASVEQPPLTLEIEHRPLTPRQPIHQRGMYSASAPRPSICIGRR